MKKLLKILAILLIVIAIGIGASIMYANTIIAKFKPELEKIASSKIGSPVVLGNLETSIFPSTGVRIDQLSVGASKDAQGFNLKNVTLALRLFPLLTGNLEITKLLIDSPSITVLKDSKGISIEGLPRPQKVEKNSSRNKDGTNQPSTAQPLPASISISLEQFNLNNATITFREIEKNLTIILDQIQVSSSLSVQAAKILIPSLEIKARLLGKIPLSLEGKSLTFDSESSTLMVPEMTATAAGNVFKISTNLDATKGSGEVTLGSPGLDLSKFDPFYDLLPQLAPIVRGFQLKGAATPDFKAMLSPKGFSLTGKLFLSGISFVSGALSPSSIGGTVEITADPTVQSLKSNDFSLQVNKQEIKAAFEAVANPDRATLKNLAAQAFGGTLLSDATLSLAEDKTFGATSVIQGMNIGQAVSAINPTLASQLLGTLTNCNLKVQGNLGPELMNSLTGNLSFLVKDGAIKDLNIAADVLRAINGLPFLNGPLINAVGGGQRNSVDSQDTALQSMSGDFVIANGGLTTKNLLIISTIFSLEGDGRVGFDTSVNLNATLTFSSDFSQSLSTKAPGLNKLLDVQGRLIIPLTLKGKGNKIIVLPNIEKLLKIGTEKFVKKKAGELLDDLITRGAKRGGSKLGVLGF